MALTAEHRAELEVLGPEIVRIRLMASDKVAAISGFATATTRSDVESWLTEKHIEGKSDHRQWCWASLFFVVVSLATAVVLLSLGVKNRLFTVFPVSLAGLPVQQRIFLGVFCMHTRERNTVLLHGCCFAYLSLHWWGLSGGFIIR